jgi:microsomal dipeptidase-like Zn-dependent dipeptidase
MRPQLVNRQLDDAEARRIAEADPAIGVVMRQTVATRRPLAGLERDAAGERYRLGECG